MSTFLSSLRRAWWSVELPGVRPHPVNAHTYSRFASEVLPPLPDEIGNDFSWLASARLHENSTLATASESARQDLLAEWLASALGANPAGAHTLGTFAREPLLRRHLRSATDCYFDLGDHFVEVPNGGRLVHFLSDSQWCRHWLLYVDKGGEESVLVTDFPSGFVLGPDDAEVYSDEPQYEICADSFVEFLWRFRIENEIWFALALDDHPPTPDEARYLGHYRGHNLPHE